MRERRRRLAARTQLGQQLAIEHFLEHGILVGRRRRWQCGRDLREQRNAVDPAEHTCHCRGDHQLARLLNEIGKQATYSEGGHVQADINASMSRAARQLPEERECIEFV